MLFKAEVKRIDYCHQEGVIANFNTRKIYSTADSGGEGQQGKLPPCASYNKSKNKVTAI